MYGVDIKCIHSLKENSTITCVSYHMCLATEIRKWKNESLLLHCVSPYGSILMLLIPYTIVPYVTFDCVMRWRYNVCYFDMFPMVKFDAI